MILELKHNIGIVNGGQNFEAVSDDTWILKQLFHIGLAKSSNFFDGKAGIGHSEMVLLFENGIPAESGLVDFENEAAKQFVVVLNRKAVLKTMVKEMYVVFGTAFRKLAVGHGP